MLRGRTLIIISQALGLFLLLLTTSTRAQTESVACEDARGNVHRELSRAATSSAAAAVLTNFTYVDGLLTQLLSSCTNSSVQSTSPAQIAVPVDLYDTARDLVASYTRTTGRQVNLSPRESTLMPSELDRIYRTTNASSDTNWDGLILDSQLLPHMTSWGAVADLGKFNISDIINLGFEDLEIPVRSVWLRWGRLVAGLPLSMNTPFLYMRKDLATKYGWQAPVTWEELANLAESIHGQDLNGDGEPDYGLCADSPFVLQILASVLLRKNQNNGGLGSHANGWAVDTPTFASLMNTSGALYSWRTYTRLVGVTLMEVVGDRNGMPPSGIGASAASASSPNDQASAAASGTGVPGTGAGSARRRGLLQGDPKPPAKRPQPPKPAGPSTSPAPISGRLPPPPGLPSSSPLTGPPTASPRVPTPPVAPSQSASGASVGSSSTGTGQDAAASLSSPRPQLPSPSPIDAQGRRLPRPQIVNFASQGRVYPPGGGFFTGRCGLAIRNGDLFKGLADPAVPRGVIGNVATLQLPGSDLVYQRLNDTVVPCDEELCLGSVIRGNKTTYLTRNALPQPMGYMGVVSSRVSLTSQLRALSFFAYMAGTDTSFAASVTNPASFVSIAGPYHTRHFCDQCLDTTTAWNATGLWDMEDVMSHRKAAQASIRLPTSPTLELRARNALTFRDRVFKIARLLMDDATWVPPEQAMNLTEAAMQEVIMSDGSVPFETLRQVYWDSVAFIPRSPPPPPPAPPPPLDTNTGVSGPTLARAIAAPVVSVLVVTALASALYALYITRRSTHRTLLGKVLPPQAGDTTCLAMSDVESSTMLWEVVPGDIMDAAMHLHHMALRETASKHAGFEAMTEGDSFTFAFWCGADAVLWAVEAQEALMHAEWPSELLAHPLCAPRFVSVVHPKHAGTKMQGAGGAGDVAAMYVPKAGVQMVQHVSALLHHRNKLQTLLMAGASTADSHAVDGGYERSLSQGERDTPGAYLRGFASSIFRRGATAGTAGALPREAESRASVELGGGGSEGEERVSIAREGEVGRRASAEQERRGSMELLADAYGSAHGFPGSPLAGLPLEPAGPGGAASDGAGGAAVQQGGAGAADALVQWLTAGPQSAAATGPVSRSTWGDRRDSGEARPLPMGTPGGTTIGPMSHSLTSGAGGTGPGVGVLMGLGGHWGITVATHLSRNAILSDVAGPGRTLLLRGLRVRIGIHAGVGVGEVGYAKGAGRVVYSGRCVEAAKAVSDAAQGGQVLLSEAAFKQVPAESLPSQAIVMHVGHFHVPGVPLALLATGSAPDTSLEAIPSGSNRPSPSSRSQAAAIADARRASDSRPGSSVQNPPGTRATAGSLQAGMGNGQAVARGLGPSRHASDSWDVHALGHDGTGPDTPGAHDAREGGEEAEDDTAAVAADAATQLGSALYLALHPALVHRCVALGMPRGVVQVGAGFLQAPHATASVGFMHIVGGAALLAWDATVAQASLDVYRAVVQRLSWAVGGYVMDMSQTTAIVAFTCPPAALRWALEVVRVCLEDVVWPHALLAHELGEEISIGVGGPGLLALTHPSNGGAAGAVSKTSHGGSVASNGHASRPSFGMGPRHPSLVQRQVVDLEGRGSRRNIGSGSAPGTPHHATSTHDPPRHSQPQGPDLGDRAIVQDVEGAGMSQPGASLTGLTKTAAGSTAVEGAGARASCAAVEGSTDGGAGGSRPDSQHKALLFRGLRLKCGVDSGSVRADLKPASGRVDYRARCLNRAARIAALATTGQVWCSEGTWRAAAPTINDSRWAAATAAGPLQAAPALTPTSSLTLQPSNSQAPGSIPSAQPVPATSLRTAASLSSCATAAAAPVRQASQGSGAQTFRSDSQPVASAGPVSQVLATRPPQQVQAACDASVQDAALLPQQPPASQQLVVVPTFLGPHQLRGVPEAVPLVAISFVTSNSIVSALPTTRPSASFTAGISMSGMVANRKPSSLTPAAPLREAAEEEGASQGAQGSQGSRANGKEVGPLEVHGQVQVQMAEAREQGGAQEAAQLPPLPPKVRTVVDEGVRAAGTPRANDTSRVGLQMEP